MPVSAPVNFVCQSIQTDLNKYFASDLIPHKRVKNNSLMRLLRSQQNRAGVELIQNDTTNQYGQKLKVRMKTHEPLCYSLLKDVWNCEDTVNKVQATPVEHLFELNDTPYFLKNGESDAPVVLTWNFNDWRKLCINQPEFFQQRLAMALARLETLVNKDLLTQISAATGTHNDTIHSASKIMPLFVPNSTTAIPSMNPFVDNEMRKAYNLARINSNYAVLGGNRFWDYAAARGLSDASQFGYNISKSQQPYEFFYDLDADDTIGANDFLTVPFGGVQLVQWSEYVGDGAIDYPDSKKFTVRTPNGLAVDVYWEHYTANRCNEIRVGLSTYAELAVVPAGGCEIGAGVNGLFRFTDCSASGAAIPCPQVGNVGVTAS